MIPVCVRVLFVPSNREHQGYTVIGLGLTTGNFCHVPHICILTENETLYKCSVEYFNT